MNFMHKFLFALWFAVQSVGLGTSKKPHCFESLSSLIVRPTQHKIVEQEIQLFKAERKQFDEGPQVPNNIDWLRTRARQLTNKFEGPVHFQILVNESSNSQSLRYSLSRDKTGERFTFAIHLPKSWSTSPELIKKASGLMDKFASSPEQEVIEWINSGILKGYPKISQRPNTDQKLQIQHLLTMVAKNDRNGVADVLMSLLRWNALEPSEQHIYKLWITAIRNPDPDRTLILFRGGVLDSEITEHKGKRGLLSKLLQNAIKHNAVTNAWSHIGGYGHLFSAMRNHTALNHNSMFISTSIDPVGARQFGGLSVLKIDQRRILPNPFSFLRENEIFVPFLIFPDEVVSLRVPLSYPALRKERSDLKLPDESYYISPSTFRVRSHLFWLKQLLVP